MRPLPPVVFALAFVLLGWIAGHSVAYDVVGLLPEDGAARAAPFHDHGRHHPDAHAGHVHGHSAGAQAYDPLHAYLDVLGPAGGAVLVLAFCLALRHFFRHGSFGEWLGRGGPAGTARQALLAAVVPAATFVSVEHLERWAASAGTAPPTRLLLVGVLVELAVGLLCLVLVRYTFRVAERVIRSVTSSRPAILRRRSSGATVRRAAEVPTLLPGPMAGSRAGRAPPLG